MTLNSVDAAACFEIRKSDLLRGLDTRFIVLSYEDFAHLVQGLGAKAVFATVNFGTDRSWEVIQQEFAGEYFIAPDRNISQGHYATYSQSVGCGYNENDIINHLNADKNLSRTK